VVFFYRQGTLDAKQKTMVATRKTLVRGQLELERRVKEWVGNKIADAENAQAKAQRDSNALDKKRQDQVALLGTKRGDIRQKDSAIAEKTRTLELMSKTQERRIVEIELSEKDVGSKSNFVNGVDSFNGLFGTGYMPQSGGYDTGFYVPSRRSHVSASGETDICTVLRVHQPASYGFNGRQAEGYSQLAAHKGLVTGDVIVGFAIGKTTNFSGLYPQQRFATGQFVPGRDSKQEEFLKELMQAEGYQDSGPKDGKKWQKLEPFVKDGVEQFQEDGSVKLAVADSTEHLFFPISGSVAGADRAYDYKKSGTEHAPENLTAMSQVGGQLLAEKLLAMNEHLLLGRSSSLVTESNGDRAIWTKVLGCMKPPLIIRVVRYVESQATQNLRADIVKLEAAKVVIQNEIANIEYDIQDVPSYCYFDTWTRQNVYLNYQDGYSTPHNTTALKRDAETELESATQNNSDQIMGPYKDLSKLLEELNQQVGGRDSKLHTLVTPGADSTQPEDTRKSNLMLALRSNFGTAAFSVHWTQNVEAEFLKCEDTQRDNLFGGPSNFDWKYVGYNQTKVFKSSTHVLAKPGVAFANAAKEWREQEVILNVAKITDKDLEAGVDALDAKVPYNAKALQYSTMQFTEKGRKQAINELKQAITDLKKQQLRERNISSKVAVVRVGGESVEALQTSISSKEEELASEGAQLREDRRTYLDSVEKQGSFAILLPAGTLGQFMAQKQTFNPKRISKPPKMDQILRNITSKDAVLASSAKELKDLKDVMRQLDNQIGDLDVEQAAHQKVFQQAKSDLKKADTERQKHIDTVSNIGTSEEVQKLRVEGIEQELSSVAQEISGVKDDLKVLVKCSLGLWSLGFVMHHSALCRTS
jgi:hypothetical protein